MQGVSAIERVAQENAGKPLRIFVVWEPVLDSDWGRPSTSTMGRLPDLRTAQFWDKGRLVSHSMGEHDDKSIVWDHIRIYPAGGLWNQKPPEALFSDGPVYKVIEPAKAALAKAFQTIPNSR